MGEKLIYTMVIYRGGVGEARGDSTLLIGRLSEEGGAEEHTHAKQGSRICSLFLPKLAC